MQVHLQQQISAENSSQQMDSLLLLSKILNSYKLKKTLQVYHHKAYGFEK